MSQYIYVRPVSKEEAIAIEVHSMNPGGNNCGYSLVINWQPTNILNGDLLSLVIQLDASVARGFFSLHNRLIKDGVMPFTAVAASCREQIQGQPVIGVGEVCCQLSEAKLYLMVVRFSIISVKAYRAQVYMDAQSILPHLLESGSLRRSDL